MPELSPTLAALQMAIQTEIDGYNFYRQFARQTGDPNAHRTFERLAQDELMHLEMLRNNKAMLEERGEWAEHRGLEVEDTLVKMEQGHLNLLESEYNYLRDQFQMAMGFAPF